MEDLRRVDTLEVPGCPEGSMKAIAYISEKQPNEVRGDAGIPALVR